VAFWFFPTVSPRPTAGGTAIYECLITSVDGTRNAFPSLHAAMGTLALWTLRRHLSAIHARKAAHGLLFLWWSALLYSTLATRQHRLLDIMAGVALAIVLIVLRRPRPLATLKPAVANGHM
jgi:membrane-associated phospholipid phosphatase